MKSTESTPYRFCRSLKTKSLCAAAAAVLTMGIVTVAGSSQVIGAHSATSNADAATVISPIPATTPTIASAGPTVKATQFAGGDWSGFNFTGGDWSGK